MTEGKTLRQIGPALFVVVLAVFLRDLRAAELEYTVAHGKLFVFGYQLEPRFPVKASRPREDDDSLISFDSSPSGRWMLIQVGESVQTDLWLYDRERKTRPVRVDARPRGRHVFANWRNDEVFEVQHAGMGYSESDFFRADDVTKKTSIEGLIYYLDFERGLYVCFYLGDDLTAGVELGRLFDGAAEKEQFPLNLDVEYLSDASFAIEQVNIIGERLMVTHKKYDGNLVQEAFLPELLKE